MHFRVLSFVKLGFVVGTAALVLFALGCASVTVKKVPAPSQYMQWSDKMQARADEMEGIRFYMPRPFVNVFESFPIRTDIYLAQGVVSPDGAYVYLTDVIPESKFATDSAPLPFSKNSLAGIDSFKIPFSYIQQGRPDPQPPADRASANQPTQPGAAPAAQSVGSGGASGGASGAPLPGEGLGRYVGREALLRILSGINGADVQSAGLTGPVLSDILTKYFDHQRALATQPAVKTPLVPALSPGGPTGLDEFKVANDNSLFAHQPLRGNFDIVYLPDFEEQYVVSSFAGLGNAKVALNLGQGWSLQGMDSLADNREINRRIFDLIDFAVQIGKTAALGAGGFTLPTPAAQSSGSGSAVIPPEQQLMHGMHPGTPVTLKFVVIHYAAKGLYPVLKPRELQQRYWAFDRRFGYRYGRHYCAIDLLKIFPQRTPASLVGMDFSPQPPLQAEGDLERMSNEALRFDVPAGGAAPEPAPAELTGHPLNLFSGQATIPVYPYQYVSFNTFRYVAIEAIRPTTDQRGPFAHVYSGTGTDDKRGLARDFTPEKPDGGGPPSGGKTFGDLMKDEFPATILVVNSDPAKGSFSLKVNSMVADVDAKKISIELSAVNPPTIGEKLSCIALRVALLREANESLKKAREKHGDKLGVEAKFSFEKARLNIADNATAVASAISDSQTDTDKKRYCGDQ